MGIAKKLHTCYSDTLIFAVPPFGKEEDEDKKYFNVSRNNINKIFF